MLYSVIADLKSHKIFSAHDIVELMIQEYLSQIEEPMISEEMTHREIQFVHLTMMNKHNLFSFLKRTPDFDISFLKNYTEDDDLNKCIFETLSLVKQLQSSNNDLDATTLVAPIDFEDHIRELQLTNNPQSKDIDSHINWAALADEKRPEYSSIELKFETIGFDGTWLKKA